MIDILFLAWNRAEFSAASWRALLANTPGQVRFHVYTDGAPLFTLDLEMLPPRIVTVNTDHHGGPVSVMNHFLSNSSAEWFAKIDNDLIVCPGWLEACGRLLAKYTSIDLLGIEPTPYYSEADLISRFHRAGAVLPVDAVRSVEPARHIGGIGLFRRAVFEDRPRPVQARDGRYGFDAWQVEYPAVRKAWIVPPLPCFLLDHLPVEPWRTLSAEYVRKGWQRQPWGEYPATCSALWDWWVVDQREY